LPPSWEVTLYCLNCQKEVPHKVYYSAGFLRKIQCQKCGRCIEIEKGKILRHYTEELLLRVFTKPSRMTDEVRKNLNWFLKSLPLRVLSKPYRMAKELVEVLKERE